MTYRDDLTALAARRDALANEVAGKTRELEDAGRMLEEARARARLPVLDKIRVAAPCSADWQTMIGDDRVRHCGDCNKNVFNLSELTRAEAEALIVEKEGRLCVRYFQRTDGTIIMKDCGVGVVRRRKRRLIAAGAAALLAGGGALALHEDAPWNVTMGESSHDRAALKDEELRDELLRDELERQSLDREPRVERKGRSGRALIARAPVPVPVPVRAGVRVVQSERTTHVRDDHRDLRRSECEQAHRLPRSRVLTRCFVVGTAPRGRQIGSGGKSVESERSIREEEIRTLPGYKDLESVIIPLEVQISPKRYQFGPQICIVRAQDRRGAALRPGPRRSSSRIT